MSSIQTTRKRTVASIQNHDREKPIVCLTAYTAMMAEIIDPYIDLLLVGDSVGTVLHGHDSTIPVTLDEMIFHAKSVMRVSPKALVVVDMPFGSYEASPQAAYESAARIMKETGADAVKLEGGVGLAGTIKFLTDRGVPVMSHIGLRPQAVRATSGYRIVGKTDEQAEELFADLEAVTQAGAFSVVLEGVVESVAREATRRASIPTIGIGAAVECDGQILVTEDMLGFFERTPKFVRKFAQLREVISGAVDNYANQVRRREFPETKETYMVE